MPSDFLNILYMCGKRGAAAVGMGLTLPLACPLYLHGSYVYLSIRKFHIVFGVYLLDVCCSVVVVRSAGVSG